MFVLVNEQLQFVGKHLAALLAAVHLGEHMELHMPLQGILAGEPIATDATLVGVLLLRLVRQVCVPVALEVSQLSKQGPADLTLVRLLACVNPSVFLQIAGVDERFPAVFTFEWPLAGVKPHVDLKCAVASELVAADHAFERTFPSGWVWSSRLAVNWPSVLNDFNYAFFAVDCLSFLGGLNVNSFCRREMFR